MRRYFPKPVTILRELAGTGPSAVRLEAIRLMGLDSLPDGWPQCPRSSLKAILRQLACDPKKAAKVRLMALKELVWNLPIEAQQEIETWKKERKQ